MIAGLEAEIVGWLSAASERTIDTACAHVFLQPDRALKLKRHEDLGYADFSTVEGRLWALDRELAFNALSAPDIYRAVRRITREADGSLALEGVGALVDHVLEMRRFDETQVLAACPEVVDGAMAEQLGRTIAGVHHAAPGRSGAAWWTPAMVRPSCSAMAPSTTSGHADSTWVSSKRRISRTWSTSAPAPSKAKEPSASRVMRRTAR